MTVRVGIIGSRGGAALANAIACLRAAAKPVDVFVLSDRDCGMLDWARGQGLETHSCAYVDADSFSAAALDIFRRNRVDQILMFYTRRVCRPLIGGLPVYNVHPGLLPAFRGMHGVDDALRAGVKIIGATVHAVDEGLDTGPIVAQVSTALPFSVTPLHANKISFLQKVYLTLVWYELVQGCGIHVNLESREVSYGRLPPVGLSVAPAIGDPALAQAFERLQMSENVRIVAAP